MENNRFDAPKNAKRIHREFFSGTHLQLFALWNRGLELFSLLTCLLRTTVQARNR